MSSWRDSLAAKPVRLVGGKYVQSDSAEVATMRAAGFTHDQSKLSVYKAASENARLTTRQRVFGDEYSMEALLQEQAQHNQEALPAHSSRKNYDHDLVAGSPRLMMTNNGESPLTTARRELKAVGTENMRRMVEAGRHPRMTSRCPTATPAAEKCRRLAHKKYHPRTQTHW